MTILTIEVSDDEWKAVQRCWGGLPVDANAPLMRVKARIVAGLREAADERLPFEPSAKEAPLPPSP